MTLKSGQGHWYWYESVKAQAMTMSMTVLLRIRAQMPQWRLSCMQFWKVTHKISLTLTLTVTHSPRCSQVDFVVVVVIRMLRTAAWTFIIHYTDSWFFYIWWNKHYTPTEMAMPLTNSSSSCYSCTCGVPQLNTLRVTQYTCAPTTVTSTMRYNWFSMPSQSSIEKLISGRIKHFFFFKQEVKI